MRKYIRSALRATASARVLAVALSIPAALAAHAAQAGALPGHGHFVSGHGTIGKANQSLTVKQSSTTGIINWKSFSIGRHDGVTFDNGRGATLNRVTGGNLSTIAGSLHATGSLYLMNGAGVIVSGTGHIVTGGSFVAASGNIAGVAFADRRFKAGAGNIVNRGSITSGGGTSLVGRNVSDSGSINASAVHLTATRTLSVDGAVRARTSGGMGGAVTARARTIVIGTDGDIDASGKRGGTISVIARGTATVAGSLKAEGTSAGGFIETSGERLHVADSAHISTLAANGKVGTWLIDPRNFYVMPTGGDISGATLSANLANNDVTISSSDGKLQGSGDIFVEDSITWSSGHKLTLDAVNDINIDADISITGAGAIDLEAGTDYNFGLTALGFLGHIDFGSVNNGGSLTIDGTSYTLLYSLDDLAAINTDSGLQGTYALATSLDGSSYSGWIPLGTDGAGNIHGSGFSGIFTGLGNSVSNLTIDIGSASYAGLFGYSAGTIRDIGVVGGSVSGGNFVGGLVSLAQGNVTDAYSSASVSGMNAGGLIGYLDEADLTDSYATGTVTGQSAGAGGGLIGGAMDSSISDVFATGAVTGASAYAGGLVGEIENTTISDAYATGAVVATFAGGLVGLAAGNGSISDVYATGSVATTNCSSGCLAGGIVGGRYPANIFTGTTVTPISNAYWDDQTTGASVGGYDVIATEIPPNSVFFSGNAIAGLSGSTTAQLQGSLPTGLRAATWGTGTGLYPFLWTFFPNGAQAVSGTVYKDGGLTTAASGVSGAVAINLDSGGSFLAQATTGANGYYYIALPAGTIANGSNLVVSTPTNASTGTVNAATLAASTYTSGTPAQTGVDLYGGYLSELTDAATLSSAPSFAGMQTDANAAAGTDTSAVGAISALNAAGYLTSASSFTIDQSTISSSFLARTDAGDPIDVATDVTIGGGASVALISQGDLTISSGMTVGSGASLSLGASGALTIAHALTVNDGGSLGLRADGVLGIDAPITAEGAASVAINYDDGNPSDLNFGLTSTGFLGSLNFSDASGNPVTTSQGGSLSINGSAYTLIYTIDDLAGINASDAALQGNYALASSLDASSYASWIPLGTDGAGTVLNGTITLMGFSGSFTGLGHTVSNLNVDTGANDYAGLFGDSTGAIRDVGVASGSVRGGDSVGGLVGYTAGSLSDDFAAATVNASANYVGGLVGLATGAISHSYATGAVSSSGDYVGGLAGLTSGVVSGSYATGAVSGGDEAGGLVGEEQSGSLTNDYATGAVSGGNYVGGLVAEAETTVSDSYATGAVSGSGNVGGFAGTLQGSISDSYWDTETSGTTMGVGSNTGSGAATPLTTRQLQGRDPISGSTYFSLASNLDDASGSMWGGGANGLYPYLSSFFPNGAQAVSGFAYSDHGTTALASGITISALVDGSNLGAATTGANGYYYILMPAGTLSGTQNLLTYVDGGTSNTYVGDASGNPSADLYGDTLRMLSDVSTASAMFSGLSTALGSNSGSGFLYDGSQVTGAAELDIVASNASGFAIDRAITDNGGLVTIDAAGALTETGAGAITANTFTGIANGPVALTSGLNAISNLQGFTTGNQAFSLTDNSALTVTGALNTGTANMHLITVGTGNDIAIDAAVTAKYLYLASSSNISESGAGAIGASKLFGSSAGATNLTSASNAIVYLENFTTGGTFSLTNGAILRVKGALNTGAASTYLTTVGAGSNIAIDAAITTGNLYLASSSKISESATGSIGAHKLVGSSVGKTNLTSSANQIAYLGAFTTGGSAFSLTDGANLTVTGAVDAGTGTLDLTTIGAGNSLILSGALMGGTVNLATAGSAKERSGTITASGILNVTANTGIRLTSPTNNITELGIDATVSGPNKVAL